MTHSTDETRIGSTLRLISKAEQAEATGTIEIQRLLAWYYGTGLTPPPMRRPGAGRSDTRSARPHGHLGSEPFTIGTSTRLPHSVHEPS